MIGYNNGSNRILKGHRYNVDDLKYHVFVDKNIGFRHVLDNRIAKEQSKNMATKHHNTLRLSDIEKPLSNDFYILSTLMSFLNRIVFFISLLIWLRPTALKKNTLDHFTFSEKDGKPVPIFTEKIEDRNRSSKSKKS